ncbi:MAG: chromate resistance protein [Proteobacteria bacterium]|nr:chromate resistance protein [Pseudomonadota bacterium]MBI3496415.1 chromate resistance protein [Pseudomonadota bacterium]
MIWVTRRPLALEPLACAWLVRRFVDTASEFRFAAVEDVDRLAAATGAIPFAVAGVRLGGIVELERLGDFVHVFRLDAPGIRRFERAVGAAANDAGAVVPEAAGARAILAGLLDRSREEQDALRLGLPLVDCLYAWCREASWEPHWHPWDPASRLQRFAARLAARCRAGRTLGPRQPLPPLGPHLLRDLGIADDDLSGREERRRWQNLMIRRVI